MELKQEFISTKKKTLCDGVKRPRKKESKKILNYKPLGRFIINRQLLNDEAIVLIKYPFSHGPVAGFSRKTVTEKMKALILDIIDTGELNIELLKKIEEEDDKIYFEKLLKKCMIDKQLNYKKYVYTLDDYIEDFNLIKASINAGNNNPELKTKLKSLIKLLSNPVINKISTEDASFLMECLEEI